MRSHFAFTSTLAAIVAVLVAPACGGGSGSGGSGTTTTGGTGGVGGTGSSGSTSSGGQTAGLPPVPPLPTPDQAAWQRRELTAFFHFGINTFTGQEWGDGTDAPALFDPTQLDASQWMSAIKDAGFRQAIVVAKHHDGFCLWPSKYTTYSVASSPWKGGEGDVVRELVDAAKAAGIKVGVYLSPWDRHEPTYGSDAYNTHFLNQLTELLTEYGEIAEVWFDGANGEGPNGKVQVYDWAAYYARIRELQPHALIAITGPDVRWVGTESGIAPVGETSVQPSDSGLRWYPSECDVSIRPGWFYHASEDSQVKPLDQLLDIYLKSVGRNSVLLLNIPPNPDGLLATADVTRLGEFGAAVNTMLGENLASGATLSADSVYQGSAGFGAGMAADDQLETFWAAADGKTSGRLEVDLGTARDINLVSLREPIELGERATHYHLEVEQDGSFHTVATGSAIGQRNLLALPTTHTRRLALVIDDARGVPAIAELGVYWSSYISGTASGSLLAHKPVTVSNVHPIGAATYGGDKALDDDMNTRWATSDGTSAAWLEVDMESTQTLGRLEIYEFAPRIAGFQLLYRVNAADAWKVAYSGGTAGVSFKTSFPQVSARYVRLDITAATDSPTIWEVRAFPQ